MNEKQPQDSNSFRKIYESISIPKVVSPLYVQNERRVLNPVKTSFYINHTVFGLSVDLGKNVIMLMSLFE